MSSLFEKLYRNKQSEQGRNQKENFLTEIFAHCLEVDLTFRNKFLSHIDCDKNDIEFHCETQYIDKEFGRPDIVIKLADHTTIVIECKVDSTQESTQLNRYASFLKKKGLIHKRLIFLTKFYEKTAEFDSETNFKHIRWYEIFELLKESSNDLSKELSSYLIEQKMNINMIPFTISDLTAIKYINDTIAKMDGFLVRLEDILKPYSKNKIHLAKKDDLNNWGDYGITTEFEDGKLWLGFYQYEHNEEMQICIDFTISLNSPSLKKFDKLLGINNLNWSTYDNEDGTREWYNARPLSTFMTDNNFQAKDAFYFIETELRKINNQ